MSATKKVRKGYRFAIQWLALNDDCEWVETDWGLSVTASLVADLFNVDDEKVRTDLLREIKKQAHEHGNEHVPASHSWRS